MSVGFHVEEHGGLTQLCLGLPGAGNNGSSCDHHHEGDSFKVAGKRGFSETVDLKFKLQSNGPDSPDLKEGFTDGEGTGAAHKDQVAKPPAKAQVVGWPPVRSFRKNNMAAAHKKTAADEAEKSVARGGATNPSASFVKVSMDGAPYLRKVDLKMYSSYKELSEALAIMFSSFTTGSYGTQGMIDFMNESKLMDLLNSSEYVPTYEDKDGDWMLVGDVPWRMFVDSCKRIRIMKGSEAIELAPRAMEKCKSRC